MTFNHRFLYVIIFYLSSRKNIIVLLILIIVQRDATQNSLFIILQVHSTCFACQPHPSSGVRKTVTTASGTGHIFVYLPPSNVTKQASRWTIINIDQRCTEP